MKATLLLKIVQMLYKAILRGLLLKAIDDPDTEWDDIVLSIVDRAFDYKD